MYLMGQFDELKVSKIRRHTDSSHEIGPSDAPKKVTDNGGCPTSSTSPGRRLRTAQTHHIHKFRRIWRRWFCALWMCGARGPAPGDRRTLIPICSRWVIGQMKAPSAPPSHWNLTLLGGWGWGRAPFNNSAPLGGGGLGGGPPPAPKSPTFLKDWANFSSGAFGGSEIFSGVFGAD